MYERYVAQIHESQKSSIVKKQELGGLGEEHHIRPRYFWYMREKDRGRKREWEKEREREREKKRQREEKRKRKYMNRDRS